MSIITVIRDYAAVQESVAALSNRVSVLHNAISHAVPDAHHGEAYENAAVQRAADINKLETAFSQDIFKAAAEITAIGGSNWEKKPAILSLWHQLALVVTNFSEHPTKQVATLIIGSQGNLQAFGANRVPEGIAKQGEHYVEGERKNYIVCSERIALARLLKLSVDQNCHLHTKPVIRKLTCDIIQAGQNNNALKDSFILVTTPPCEDHCAPVILPFKPKGIMMAHGKGTHFSRKAAAEDVFTQQGIPIIWLPELAPL